MSSIKNKAATPGEPSKYDIFIAKARSSIEESEAELSKDKPAGNIDTTTATLTVVKDESFTQFDYIRKIISDSHDVKFNVLSQRIEIDSNQITEFTLNYLWDFVARKSEGSYPNKDKLKGALYVATWPNYHPIKQFFETLPAWDQEDRIKQLVDCMKSERPEHTYPMLSKWLIGVISCLYGTPNPLVLVLVGKMGTGKTEFFRRLFPKELSAFFAESHLNEKDRVNTMNMNLLVCDDELLGIKKMGPEEFKSLTSQAFFTETRKYEAQETKLDRIASICGTSNTFDILTEEQNRRFLPINITDTMDWVAMALIDRYQLCAQIFHYHITGVDWQILGSEIESLTEYCSDYERHTAEDEIIRQICSVPEKTDTESYLTATQILEAILLNTPHKTLNKYNVGRALKRAGFIQDSKRVNGNVVRVYHVKLTF